MTPSLGANGSLAGYSDPFVQLVAAMLQQRQQAQQQQQQPASHGIGDLMNLLMPKLSNAAPASSPSSDPVAGIAALFAPSPSQPGVMATSPNVSGVFPASPTMVPGGESSGEDVGRFVYDPTIPYTHMRYAPPQRTSVTSTFKPLGPDDPDQ